MRYWHRRLLGQKSVMRHIHRRGITTVSQICCHKRGSHHIKQYESVFVNSAPPLTTYLYIFKTRRSNQHHQFYFSNYRQSSELQRKALEEEFKEYAEMVKSLPPGTKDADKLVLYGLYKQSTVGAINTNRPGIFSPADRAKWDAWKAVEGKTKEEAMAEYIAKVKQLQQGAN